MSNYKLKGSTIKCNRKGKCKSPFMEMCKPPDFMEVKTDKVKLLECLGCKDFRIEEGVANE